tara:strand:+ start:2796 stop:3269 length:474 start_codon:yes stop_codon:yes gene_type:complete
MIISVKSTSVKGNTSNTIGQIAMNNKVSAAIYALRENTEPEDVIQKIKDGLLAGRQVDGQWFVEVKGNETSESKKTDKADPQKPEFLVQVLNTLASFTLIASFVMCLFYWPETRRPATSEFFISMLWLASGIIQCALFASIGKVLHYLRLIAENTKK